MRRQRHYEQGAKERGAGKASRHQADGPKADGAAGAEQGKVQHASGIRFKGGPAARETKSAGLKRHCVLSIT
ncbi:hypothetical protein GCM10017643_39250 [Ancylobacter dichloromethanicus]|uniref:Uncharacterized protein n=1 Tax=Ancylobacter dichloromethanicus TaxID=518825 RepID=A0A9W6JB93_9HYPH|nr:hypothetical protein GCM10017643_39250 [Ancylobacter dichloromethanicus]